MAGRHEVDYGGVATVVWRKLARRPARHRRQVPPAPGTTSELTVGQREDHLRLGDDVIGTQRPDGGANGEELGRVTTPAVRQRQEAARRRSLPPSSCSASACIRLIASSRAS